MGEMLSTLKKRSGASYRSRRDSPLEIFVDRCLGKHTLPGELRKLPGVVVRIHDDYFKPDEQDAVWLPKAAEKGWVILTKDKDIRHRKIELDAILRNNAYFLTFGQGHASAVEMARAFITALPRIRKAVSRYEPPLLASISKSGDLTIL
jgi:hypothetical protein